MTVKKSLPGPGNPVFYFWTPNFRSELIDHPNAVFLAFVSTTSPNQWRPPLAPFLNPSDFGGPSEFDGTTDSNSWNLWRKALGSLDHVDWEDCIKCHLRACARAAADSFEYCRYYKGTGSRGNGFYESGVALNNLGTFFNSQSGDTEWYDVARLYAHPDDRASYTTPDTTMTLDAGEPWYLPANEKYTHMGGLNAALYTPWCENGIAEVAPLVLYFAQQLKAECDARNLCYPAELVLDNEQSPLHWTLGNLDGLGNQIGNFNNVREDPCASMSTVYEIKNEFGEYVPMTYDDHFAAQDTAEGGAVSAALGLDGRFHDYYNVVPIHRMLWRLYTFAYDYAEQKAFYEPWKSFFPLSKCGNYDNRHVLADSEKKILINYDSNVAVACEHMRSDISSPVLYPNVNHPTYEGNTDPYKAFLADASDIVESCDKVGREFRGWVRMPTLPNQNINTHNWSPDRFARFIEVMGRVGGNSFYVFNDPGWDGDNNDLIVDSFKRALVYSNRSMRELDLINIGGGKRR